MNLKLKEIIKFFDEEEKNILQALENSYGIYKAEKIFVENYKKSNIPLAVALRRIRNIKSKIENLKTQTSPKSQSHNSSFIQDCYPEVNCTNNIDNVCQLKIRECPLHKSSSK